MAVILELTVAPETFEIGQILAVPRVSSVTLETLVPLGESAIPLVRLHHDGHAEFERQVRNDERVRSMKLVNDHDGERLYALDWDVSGDQFFQAIRRTEAHVLEATGTTDRWEFRLWFPDHELLSAFQRELDEADLAIEVQGIYNPTRPDAGPWYGLTKPQRDALSRAVAAGYYDIPRRISTNELAAEFDISDQALTERLRRAIRTLTTNALLIEETGD